MMAALFIPGNCQLRVPPLKGELGDAALVEPAEAEGHHFVVLGLRGGVQREIETHLLGHFGGDAGILGGMLGPWLL